MLILGALLLICSLSAPAQTISLTYRGLINTGQSCAQDGSAPVAVNGLSGITHVHGDQFLAVMDNSNLIVRMTIVFQPDGSMGSATYGGIIKLGAFHDYEGIAVTEEGEGLAFLSEEDTPAIHTFRLSDGALLETLKIHAVFAGGNTRGNFGFESLTVGKSDLWTANEEALRSDGDRSSVSAGTVVRLSHFVLKNHTWSTAEQFAYVVDPIRQAYNDADRSMSRSGLSDLMLLPDGRLLALERAFALSGPGNLLSKFRNSIYVLERNSATDISREPFARGLGSTPFAAVRKTLLWSHSGNEIGNLEGFALGPKLEGDRWAVVGVVDNNAKPFMPNRVVSFELTLEPSSPSSSAR